ncbi:MAG TPA: phage holin family protein [Opitutales bacterium]|jgi:uncharacterized membrane protein YqjE|nr:phage holin family protein [Opitutales bacterium]
MKTPAPPTPAGYLASLRSLGDGFLAAVHERVELFVVEFQEEKFRLCQTFIWFSAVFFAGAMAVTFASLTLVYLFWDSARLAVLGGLAAFYIVTLIVLLVAFSRYLARQPASFSQTKLELQEDRACIRNGN